MILTLIAAASFATHNPVTPAPTAKTNTTKQLIADLHHANAHNSQVTLVNAPAIPSSSSLGSSFIYCDSTASAFGEAAHMSVSGSLDLTGNTFALTVTGVPPVPQSWGMFTYGLAQTNIPFGNGNLCISPFNPGIYRMTPQSLGNGTVTRSMQDTPQEFVQIQTGSSWNFQFWYRDPTAGGANFNLSDGLHVDFAPPGS